ncbi:putative clathrin heavy chain [Cardiosporidium cionae]|uniref:Clathrin heavy chain n=1 Tax=Cardiosporidium cionae TaxID=476202 RepID=A0ABQ7JCJ2_9APIC|nr:putative clathrin heavy chain [Cardiosporidium cionae]|eukprot:KAF8821696.1 putative clathrin heavy chain [Cardiosporidium cionae]
MVEKGINKESCHYGNLSMESSKYISLKDTGSDGSAQLVVVYVDDDNNVTRKPMKAEASIMHPTENLIVLRAKTDQAGHFVQVYNFDSKEKLGTHQFAEPIGLWKWVTKRTLGVVTSKSVYHWEVDSKTAPTKIFDRSGKLAESGIQLMNYTVDDSLKWAALTGLAKEGDPVAIYGTTLLYSIERKQSRVLDTHAACFGELMVDSKRPVLCFIEKKKDASSPKLLIMDIFTPREEGGVPPLKVSGDVEYTAEQGNDFPISVHLSKSYGVLYLLTKNGFLMLFDPVTATLLFRHRISQESLFASCYNEKTGGVYAVNRGGLVLSATISEQTFIPFIQNSLAHVANRQQIALGFAKRYGLPGADDLLIQVFSQHFAKGEYQQAARIVGLMKSGALRNSQVLDQFKTAAASPGQPSPILTYFQALLETGKLNALESKEIVIPIVAQGRREFIEKWLKDDQLECTEELGDIVKPLDGKLSLSIYLRANASPKVVQSFVEQGQYEQIVAYCNKVNYQADFTTILRNIVAINPEGTAVFCQKLLDQDPPLVDINQVIDILSQQSRLQELTSILLEYLKTDRADQGHIQTRLLELNLLNVCKIIKNLIFL